MGGTSKWQREVVQDHKFDFVDVAEFSHPSPYRKLQYAFTFVIVIKSVLVYLADFWTAFLLLTSGRWANSINPTIPITISKWIFVACICISYLLLLWEFRKARRIVKSRDIAYAFTNIVAYRVYCIKSYAHYCLFRKIGSSNRKQDQLAFFIFFRLKGWKRILLAEAPRQVINGVTMWALFYDQYHLNVQRAIEIERNGDIMRQITFCLMAFTFVMFALSAIALVVAFFLYIPLLCVIRGNLKEYVCHLIDKRIAELLRRNTRKRILNEQKMRKELARQANGDAGSIHSKSGSISKGIPLTMLRQPTLPQMGQIDDDARSVRTAHSGYAGGMVPPPPYYAGSGFSANQDLTRSPSMASNASQFSTPAGGFPRGPNPTYQYAPNMAHGSQFQPPPVPAVPARADSPQLNGLPTALRGASPFPRPGPGAPSSAVSPTMGASAFNGRTPAMQRAGNHGYHGAASNAFPPARSPSPRIPLPDDDRDVTPMDLSRGNTQNGMGALGRSASRFQNQQQDPALAAGSNNGGGYQRRYGNGNGNGNGAESRWGASARGPTGPVTRTSPFPESSFDF